MTTIYGKEHFIDKSMINILWGPVDVQIINGVAKATRKYGVDIDERKVKEWLDFCAKLDNIDNALVIESAIKMKFEQKDMDIKILRDALYLAVETLRLMDGCPYDEDYYINKARERNRR